MLFYTDALPIILDFVSGAVFATALFCLFDGFDNHFPRFVRFLVSANAGFTLWLFSPNPYVIMIAAPVATALQVFLYLIMAAAYRSVRAHLLNNETKPMVFDELIRFCQRRLLQHTGLVLLLPEAMNCYIVAVATSTALLFVVNWSFLSGFSFALATITLCFSLTLTVTWCFLVVGYSIILSIMDAFLVANSPDAGYLQQECPEIVATNALPRTTELSTTGLTTVGAAVVAVFAAITLLQLGEDSAFCMPGGGKGFLSLSNTAKAARVETKLSLNRERDALISLSRGKKPSQHINVFKGFAEKPDLFQRLIMKRPTGGELQKRFDENHSLAVSNYDLRRELLLSNNTVYYPFVVGNHMSSNHNQLRRMFYHSIVVPLQNGCTGINVVWPTGINRNGTGFPDYFVTRESYTSKTKFLRNLEKLPFMEMFVPHQSKASYSAELYGADEGELGQTLHKHIAENIKKKFGSRTTALDFTVMQVPGDTSKVQLYVKATANYLAGKDTTYIADKNTIEAVYIIDFRSFTAARLENYHIRAEKLDLHKPDVQRRLNDKVSKGVKELELRKRMQKPTSIKSLVESGSNINHCHSKVINFQKHMKQQRLVQKSRESLRLSTQAAVKRLKYKQSVWSCC